MPDAPHSGTPCARCGDWNGYVAGRSAHTGARCNGAIAADLPEPAPSWVAWRYRL